MSVAFRRELRPISSLPLGPCASFVLICVELPVDCNFQIIEGFSDDIFERATQWQRVMATNSIPIHITNFLHAIGIKCAHTADQQTQQRAAKARLSKCFFCLKVRWVVDQ